MCSVLARICCGPCRWYARRVADAKLRTLTIHTTRRWVAPICRAKVIGVYDGDTVTLAAYISGQAYKFRCRLARIDAPEMRSNVLLTRAQQDAEKRAAILSRNALSSMALDRLVTVSHVKNEKWGRVLAELTVDGTDTTLSDRMLRLGMAIPYDGGPKNPWNWTHFPVRQRNPMYVTTVTATIPT